MSKKVKRKIIVFSLLILLFASIGMNIYQSNQYHALRSQYDANQQAYGSAITTIKNYEDQFTQMEHKVNYYDEHVVFLESIIKDKNIRYHSTTECVMIPDRYVEIDESYAKYCLELPACTHCVLNQ